MPPYDPASRLIADSVILANGERQTAVAPTARQTAICLHNSAFRIKRNLPFPRFGENGRDIKFCYLLKILWKNAMIALKKPSSISLMLVNWLVVTLNTPT